MTVNYTTADGTATAGSDYTATSGMLTFAPGTMTQTMSVPVIGDITTEPDETFSVDLSGATNATITTATGTGTIENDEGLPTLSINNVTQAEGDSGTTEFVFTVTLTGSTSQTVTVDYATADGIATAGFDYTTTTGRLTFAPGTMTQTIAVPVIGDTTTEPDETFTVTLSDAANAVTATPTGTGTIENDDAPMADLAVTKEIVGSGPFLVSQNVSFAITVSNSGPDDATNVVVSDPVPAGMTFVSATPSQGSCTGTTTIICSLGIIPNGGSATVDIALRIDQEGSITNSASVSSDLGDPDPTNSASSATVAALAASQIPTLSQWVLMLLALSLIIVAVRQI